MPQRSALKDTKGFVKLLHCNFLLRDLRDLRGEMPVSSLVAPLPFWDRAGAVKS
jgi:hypothetical protein